MAVFRLKDIRPPAPDEPIHWTYDDAELLADGIVHAIGVSLVVAGAIALFMFGPSIGMESYFITVYVIGLLMTLGMSATYNLWPVSPVKWLLRRLDHSAIYLLIAATYSPFVFQVATVNSRPCS